jgi:hypothetical protein
MENNTNKEVITFELHRTDIHGLAYYRVYVNGKRVMKGKRNQPKTYGNNFLIGSVKNEEGALRQYLSIWKAVTWY